MPVVDTIFIGFLLRVPVNELQHQAGDRIVGRDGAEHDRVMVPLVHFEKFRLASLPDQSFLELFGQVGQGRQILFRCKQQEWRQPGPDVANEEAAKQTAGFSPNAGQKASTRQRKERNRRNRRPVPVGFVAQRQELIHANCLSRRAPEDDFQRFRQNQIDAADRDNALDVGGS